MPTPNRHRTLSLQKTTWEWHSSQVTTRNSHSFFRWWGSEVFFTKIPHSGWTHLTFWKSQPTVWACEKQEREHDNDRNKKSLKVEQETPKKSTEEWNETKRCNIFHASFNLQSNQGKRKPWSPVYTSNFYVTTFMWQLLFARVDEWKWPIFMWQIHLLKSLRVSFYVTNKNCHTRNIARVNGASEYQHQTFSGFYKQLLKLR